MQSIKQRPFAFSCCLFLALTSLILTSDILLKIILLSVLLIITVIALIFKIRPNFLLIYVIPPILVSTLVSLFFGINYTNIKTYEGKECNVEFIVLEENTVSDRTSSYRVKTQTVNGYKTSFEAIVRVSGKLDMPLYRSYSSSIKFSSSSDSVSRSEEYSNISSGAYVYGICAEDVTLIKEEVKLFPSYYFQKLNSFLSSIFEKYLDGEENALSEALLLGNKQELTDNTKYNFRKLGLSHMLAVSGLHLSLLVASLDLAVGKLKLNKKRKYLLMISFVVIYAGMTGFSPSVKRASIMLIIYYLSFLIAKSNDSITSLCISAAAICFFSPNSIYDIGLWLSFASTYGILAVALPISEDIKEKAKYSITVFEKLLAKLYSALLLGVVPVLFSIPVIWLSYREIAVLSPISNILFTPLLLAIMYSCPIMLVLSVIPPVGYVVSLVPKYSSKAMLFLADLLADYSPLVDIDYKFTLYIVIFLFASILLISLSNTKIKLLYFIPFVISIIAFSVSLYVYKQSTLPIQKAIYISDSFGDSFLIISKNQAIACDVSGGNDTFARYLIDQADKNHISKFQGYIITDYHADGLDTVKELAESDWFKTLYLPSAKARDDILIQNEFLSLAKSCALSVVIYERDGKTPISFNGIDIFVELLSATPVNTADSLCVKIASEEYSYAYMGLGYDSTLNGRVASNRIFSKCYTYVFGNYGVESEPWILKLKFRESIKAFFPTDDLYEHYSKVIPSNSDVYVIDPPYTLPLN